MLYALLTDTGAWDEVINTVINKVRFVTEEEIKISFSVVSELDVGEFNLR
jgi:hypothetical protein